MTYELFTDLIGKIAINTELCNFFMEGNIQELNPLTTKQYPAIVMTGNGPHIERENTMTYHCTFYYIDRLLDSDSNSTSIHSTGIEVLRDLLLTLRHLDFVIDIPFSSFRPFVASDTQVLADRCAGVYTEVDITVLKNSVCPANFDIYFKSLDKVEDYFYTIEPYLDYGYAMDYFKGKAPAAVNSCTSVVRTNASGETEYGRNLDWFYSNYVDFLVRTDNTLGVAGGNSIFVKDFVEGTPSEIWKIIPFYLQDGFNRSGVYANINVVNIEAAKGTTTYTVPDIDKRDEICSLMLVRFILDKFTTATEAVEYIKNYVSIYPPKGLTDMGYDSHWMIGDKYHTYVLEMVNNKVVYREEQIMANFYSDGTSANTDGTYYSIIDNPNHNPVIENGLTPYASGMERYNIAVNWTGDTRGLMDALLYTNAYTLPEGSDFWYSEFVGGNLTVESSAADYGDMIARAKEEYAKRRREKPVTWQTTHSCVYNIDRLSVEIRPQEGDNIYTYTL